MISMPSSVFTRSGSRYLFGELEEAGTVVCRGTSVVRVSTVAIDMPDSYVKVVKIIVVNTDGPDSEKS